MIRKLALTAMAALYIFNCHAQDEVPDGKMFNYYVGVQANQLLKEIINLNSSSAAIENPYLIIASAYSPKCGWGINTGFGFSYQDISDQLAPSDHESKINNSFYRVGIGRKVMISKKFEVGYGFDYTGNYQYDQTFSNSVTNLGNSQDSTISTSVSKTTTTGYGLQVTLGFHITEKIIISTEATYYYTKSAVKTNVILTDYFTDFFNPSNDATTLSSSNSSTIVKNYTFTLPVALFLVIKF